MLREGFATRQPTSTVNIGRSKMNCADAQSLSRDVCRCKRSHRCDRLLRVLPGTFGKTRRSGRRLSGRPLRHVRTSACRRILKDRANCLQRNDFGARCKPPGRDRADDLYLLSVGCDRISVFSVQKYIDGDTPRTVRKSLTRERQTARRTS